MRRAPTLPPAVSRQHCLVTHKQLVEAGWSQDGIDHALLRWRTVLPGVYLVRDRPLDTDVRAMAALLRWPDALLSHTTAAHYLGWPILDRLPAWPYCADDHWPDESDVHVTSKRRLRSPAGFVTHRTDPGPTVYIRDVRITDRVRTLLDVARTAPLPVALPIIDAATHLSPWLLDDLATEASQLGGQRNITRAHRATSLASSLSESVLETLLRLLIVLSGLPPPDVQIPVRAGSKTYFGDLGYREKQILIEADGRDYHSEWTKVTEDMMRHNALAGQGWIVLRFSWAQVMFQPDLVINTIRDALRGRERSPKGRRSGL